MSTIQDLEVNKIKWDYYFHKLCEAVSVNSPCLSRQIGAIIVKDKSIVSTGYNGPARGIPHCGTARFERDLKLVNALGPSMSSVRKKIPSECPRKLLGYASGQHLEMCIAEHAERNCIANAAKLGVSTDGATMYMNCVISCKNCLTLIINAGIKELIVDSLETYDDNSNFILENSSLYVRTFRRYQ